MKGGLGENSKPEDFDPKQIEIGKKIEMEHTDDENLALEIAMDHLVEHPRYYDYLVEMEKEMEGNKKESYFNIDFTKNSKKRKSKYDKPYNPYSVCTTSVGETAGTTERSEWDKGDKERYDRCIDHIRDQNKKGKKKSKKADSYFDISKLKI